MPSVGEQLNAEYILEGSVRTAGDQIRITAQLIHASTDTHRWSNTYDRTLDNIFEIQDEIAAAVVDELKLQLLGDAPTLQRIDEEAYKLVLQARYLWNRRAEGDAQRVLELYQQVIEMAPDYSPAWSGLSVAYAVHASQEWMDRDEGRRLAMEAAEKAIELDPNSAEAHVRMGQALARADDRDGMWTAYNRALELDPNSPLALGVAARWLQVIGEYETAIEYISRAEEIDPLGAIWPGNKGTILMNSGDLDGAEKSIERAYELNGNLKTYSAYMADIALYRHDFEAMYEHLQNVEIVRQYVARMAIAQYRTGRIEEAQELEQLILDTHGPFVPIGMSMIYAWRDDPDTAFEWLYKDTLMSHHDLTATPFYSELYDDPRWEPLVESFRERDAQKAKAQ